MMHQAWYLVFWLFLAGGASATTVIRVNVDLEDHHTTSFRIIKAALDATKQTHGDYTFKRIKGISQGRAEQDLIEGKRVDMLWFATDRIREEKLLSIPIPLDGGLLGYRVCLIKKGTQSQFNNIKVKGDLVKYGITLGSGDYWPDTNILKANGLSVVTSPMYYALFDMLKLERFDCFLRSVLEIENEVRRPENQSLVIEDELLLAYPQPTFLFVNKSNKKLAQRMHLGLTRIKKSGEFERLSAARLLSLKNLHLPARRLIQLSNPSLSEATKEILKDPSLWVDIKKL